VRGVLSPRTLLTNLPLPSLLAHFRAAFAADAPAAYRDWFRAQEELREKEDAATARALADDFWDRLPGLAFDSTVERARFRHNAAVFFGSPGPAADLARARPLFDEAIAYFSDHADDGWRARVQHNFATALSNLGSSAGEIEEALRLFEDALSWRTPERDIARGVTLHNMGLAWRRFALLDPARRQEALDRSAACLREAIAIRERHGLTEGLEASRRELDRTLEAAR
jgi:tetratricopeptide (TPR) repeat protein